MSDVVLEEVGEGEVKPILYSDLLQTGLLLNRTNENTIAAAYGLETDEWRGQPIQLYPASTTFRGSVVPCVRVRVPDDDQGRVRGQRIHCLRDRSDQVEKVRTPSRNE